MSEANTPWPDDDLDLKFRSGDLVAFDKLLALHGRAAFSLLFRRCRYYAKAEELYQETCLAAWQSRATFKIGSSFRNWFCGIASKKGIDDYRKHKREPKIFWDVTEDLQIADPAERIDHELAYRELHTQVVNRLPEFEQRVLAHIQVDDLTDTQIAESLNSTLESIKKSKRRIREVGRRLRKERQC